MERERLKTLILAKPFQPFTVHLDDGDLIGVVSPEYIWLPPIGKTFFIITREKQTEAGDEGEMKMLSLDHVSQVSIGPSANLTFPMA